MIDLKKKPFFLDEEACQWVKKTGRHVGEKK